MFVPGDDVRARSSNGITCVQNAFNAQRLITSCAVWLGNYIINAKNFSIRN